MHLDVRSDNLCFAGDRCLLVDWALAARGNPLLDLAIWLPTLSLEGGPPPDGVPGELAAVIAGYMACRVALPEPAPGVRALQLAIARIALPWAARCLQLPES